MNTPTPGSSSGPGPVSVDQTYYIAALESDVAREAKARRVLQALNAQHEATIAAYLDRYGDITADTTDQPADGAGEGAADA